MNSIVPVGLEYGAAWDEVVAAGTKPLERAEPVERQHPHMAADALLQKGNFSCAGNISCGGLELHMQS